jgi:rRNA maturation protein Nop10
MLHPSICKNCGYTTSGNYCEQCGQRTAVAQITLHSIVHEVFHYFTHLDKGFGYTLKKLITEPGTMQRRYIEGERSRHQKPFSMFFICGTISGLGYYFINLGIANLYGLQNETETGFFRHYFVLLQALLLPLYTFITWLCFKSE